MRAPRLELRGVARFYNSGEETVAALDGVDLIIEPGEMVAIVGASGSGKSTLVNIMGCLDRPNSGQYFVGEVDVGKLDSDDLARLRRDCFGFVFQRYHLINTLTISGNVELPGIYSGMPADQRRRRANRIIGYFGLSDRRSSRPNQLSGGQQQRIAIARALMNDASVVLADEPTGALDRRSGEAVLSVLKELHAEGRTIIIITHDRDVASHAQRTVEFADGRIIADSRQSCIQANSLAETGAPYARHNPFPAVVSRIVNAFAMSFRAMVAQKLRTGLTMLGIIIGVTAVVAVIGLGEGARNTVMNQLSVLGTNSLGIYPGRDFGDPNASAVVSLTAADADALAAQPYVDSTSPEIAASLKGRNGGLNANLQVSGVGPSYFRTNGMRLVAGPALTSDDVTGAHPNVVLSDIAASTLFKDTNPTGRTVLIDRAPVTVVGVVALPGSGDTALNAYMAHSAFRVRLVGAMPLANITLRIRYGVDSDLVERAVSNLLARRHGVKDFFIVNSEQIRRSTERTMATFSLLIASLAAVALLVGGIGVMNIMLISVGERTREIGLRMAVGARHIDIMTQFMIEAIVVCLVGGSLGIAVAFGLAALSDVLLLPLPIILSFDAILLASGFTVLVGLVFGYLPARTAARLDPVQALASE
ncbi:ABC transporter permease [Ensifer canadensis]